MNNLIPIADVEKMALAMAKSGLFGAKTQEQAFALMMIAQSEGIHPAQACMEFDIIQGKPVRKSTALLGRFQQAGGKVSWIDHTDTKVTARFWHDCCPDPIEITWDIDRAKKAGLVGKDNWIKYPRAMLRARVIAEGVRACYPSVCSGMMVAEEAQDEDVPVKPLKPANTVEGLKEAIKAQDAEIVQPTAPQMPVKPSELPLEGPEPVLPTIDEAIADFNGETVKTPSLANLEVNGEIAEVQGLIKGINVRDGVGKNKDKTITEYRMEDAGGNQFIVAKWGSPKDGIEQDVLATFLSVKRQVDFKDQKKFMCQDIIVN